MKEVLEKRVLKINKSWLYRLVVRTSGFHPANRGSIPRRATKLLATNGHPANRGSQPEADPSRAEIPSRATKKSFL